MNPSDAFEQAGVVRVTHMPRYSISTVYLDDAWLDPALAADPRAFRYETAVVDNNNTEREIELHHYATEEAAIEHHALLVEKYSRGLN
jgi:hypothetical protein